MKKTYHLQTKEEKAMKIRHIMPCKKHFRFSVKAYLFIFVLLSTLFTQSKAQVYDYTALQGTGDYFPFAQYRIYVPDTVSSIRGIYFFVNGVGSDSSPSALTSPTDEI